MVASYALVRAKTRAANFRRNRLARAGFAKSFVSSQNRLVERHDALYGAYWKSYDFKPNSAVAKLTRYPLGPLLLFDNDGKKVKNDYADQAFAHDGGEIIFNLPNGLQGYFLVDGRGHRLDKGPTAIVSDPRRPDRAVENGISCMSCHAQGIIVKADQVRDSLAKNAKARATFDTLSFTHRKEYVVWIIEAKKAETRSARLGKTVEMLSKGKKNPSDK